MKEQLKIASIETRVGELAGSDIVIDISKEIFVPFTGSKVFFVTTRQGTPAVVKIPASRFGARREWEGLNKAYFAGVPTPKPLALVALEGGVQALISERVSGMSLYLSPNNQLRGELGEIIRFMHENAGVEGKEWSKSGRSSFDYFERYKAHWQDCPIRDLNKNSTTQALLAKFSDQMSRYCKITLPVFNHNDLHDGQARVQKGGKLKLYDFENWREESPLNELAYYLFHTIRTNKLTNGFDDFLRGYLGSRSLGENEKSSLMFYLVFISARAVSYFQSVHSGYLDKALYTHQKILEYVDSEKLWIKF